MMRIAEHRFGGHTGGRMLNGRSDANQRIRDPDQFRMMNAVRRAVGQPQPERLKRPFDLEFLDVLGFHAPPGIYPVIRQNSTVCR